jgi:hypothetical protein
MNRGRRARLDRLSRGVREADAAVERYHVLRARAAIGDAVRRHLAETGIDPHSVPALRVADEAAAELARLGDPPPLPGPAREPGGRSAAGDPETALDRRLDRLAARYRESPGRESPGRDGAEHDGAGRDSPRAVPDFARASLAELFAWCIAAGENRVDST